MLKVLPQIAREEHFAMHGGTAINLFVRDIPRISVDIDLTYLPLEDRQRSLLNIQDALQRMSQRIVNAFPHLRVSTPGDSGKLQIRSDEVNITIEVNLTMRGTIETPERMVLSNGAQEAFSASAIMRIVPLGQLYGGKICAALDRQHPRDLFDIKYLFENEGFSDEVRKGFLYCLLCADGSINEMLDPNFHDQRSALLNQFSGMTDIPFTYADFEKTREELLSTIHEKLTDSDRTFILAFKRGEPDWSIYDFERFPAVQWKLQNILRLKENNPQKHDSLYQALENTLTSGPQKSIDRQSLIRQMNEHYNSRFHELKDKAGASLTFWTYGTQAVAAAGSADSADWSDVERKVIVESIGQNGQSPEDVANVLCEYSPGALTGTQKTAIRNRIRQMAPKLQAQYAARQNPVNSPDTTKESDPSLSDPSL